MQRLRVGIIGGEKQGSDLCRILMEMAEVEIMAVAGDNLRLPRLSTNPPPVYTLNQFKSVVAMPGVDMIFVAESGKGLLDEIRQAASREITVVEPSIASLLVSIGLERTELLEFKRLKSELSAILHAMQEAIEVADKDGVIRYVNPAFARVTGIPESMRIGQNIFQVSPHGALAQALLTKQLILNHRTKVGGSGVEVISNASPILSDGNLEGAVVVFQPMTDILKLMEDLRQSNTIIENLYDKIGQISGSKYTFEDLIGESPGFTAAVNMAKKTAPGNSTVLIYGESGTGKELMAHAIHNLSPRRDKPFVKISCAFSPENHLESELFGHEKGAFSGAMKTKLGKVELAHGGTLFLDEIGDMNLYLQAKLLRFLQEMEFERVGGNQTYKVDARIITTTNRDLKLLVRQGAFREDLYYRLNVVRIAIPPLRERKEDIPLLVNHMIIKFNRKLGKKVKGMSLDALEMISGYSWPGNIRELENFLERLLVATEEEILSRKLVSHYFSQFEPIHGSREIELMPIDRMEALLLKAALDRFGYTLEGKKQAAKVLNISLATLYNKLRKYQSPMGDSSYGRKE